MRITQSRFVPTTVAVAQPPKKYTQGFTPPRPPENYLEAKQLEAQLRRQWRCQEAKKLTAAVAGFALGAAVVHEIGLANAIGLAVVHKAAVETAKKLVEKEPAEENK